MLLLSNCKKDSNDEIQNGGDISEYCVKSSEILSAHGFEKSQINWDYDEMGKEIRVRMYQEGVIKKIWQDYTRNTLEQLISKHGYNANLELEDIIILSYNSNNNLAKRKTINLITDDIDEEIWGHDDNYNEINYKLYKNLDLIIDRKNYVYRNNKLIYNATYGHPYPDSIPLYFDSIFYDDDGLKVSHIRYVDYGNTYYQYEQYWEYGLNKLEIGYTQIRNQGDTVIRILMDYKEYWRDDNDSLIHFIAEDENGVRTFHDLTYTCR